MEAPLLRLGDTIDDYCRHCRLLMNHYVVSMINGEVRKVRCQTCHYEHDYLHGVDSGKKKGTRQALFDQIAGTLPPTVSPPQDAKAKKKKR
jgi:hypothetical protein